MAEGSITLPPDSTGTALRTITNAGVASGRHQEVITLAKADGSFDVTTEALRDELLNIRRALTDYETRLSYGGETGFTARTDGNPVFVGKAPQGTATSAATWTVQLLEYDASNRLTRAQVRSGLTWDNRHVGW